MWIFKRIGIALGRSAPETVEVQACVKPSETTETSLSERPKPYEVGQTIEGTISAFLDYGINVMMANGEQGYLSRVELSADFNSVPRQIGDSITATVLRMHPQKGAYLSMTRLPISALPDGHLLDVGSVHRGVVKLKKDYGLFVTLDCGVTGLLHSNRFTDQAEFAKLKKGHKLSVRVMEVNREENKVQFDLV